MDELTAGIVAAVVLGALALLCLAGGRDPAPAPSDNETIPKKPKARKQKKPEVAPGPVPAGGATVTNSGAPSKKKKKQKKKNARPAGPERGEPGEAADEKRAESGERKKTKKPAVKRPAAAAAATTKKNVPPPDEDDWDLVPSRTRKQKSAAPKAVEAVPTSTIKLVVAVESKAVATIIGSGGATIKKLKDATGVDIDIPKSDNGTAQGPTVNITITGVPEEVKRCGEAIKQLAKLRISSITHGDIKEGKVEMHPDYFWLLRNNRAEALRRLQDWAKISIIIPESTPAGRTSYVKLVGPTQGVQDAKAAIKLLMREYHHPVTHPGMVHAELDIPVSEHNLLIGHRGQTIKSIEGNTRAKINIPRQHYINQKVVVVGLPAQVKTATAQIENAMAKAYAESAKDQGYDARDSAFDDDDW